LFVPDGGAAVNTICPLITAYVFVACLTPSMKTNTDASLPYVYDNVYVVAEPVPEKNSETTVPPDNWLPR